MPALCAHLGLRDVQPPRGDALYCRHHRQQAQAPCLLGERAARSPSLSAACARGGRGRRRDGRRRGPLRYAAPTAPPPPPAAAAG
ncbi:Os03g0435000 [Oryza sativa Japonica Group]|uniref:Os03g0435000 protein n=1 Tax=Oryza sativa subsp. japonica TaxID=39947 RepID=A0A0P0VZT3_ORYSJ|nr:Os03g0435000 [Oryza sativa Japonica Group]